LSREVGADGGGEKVATSLLVIRRVSDIVGSTAVSRHGGQLPASSVFGRVSTFPKSPDGPPPTTAQRGVSPLSPAEPAEPAEISPRSTRNRSSLG